MTSTIERFHLNIAQSELDNLRDRRSRTRWPDAEAVDDTSQGPLLGKVRALAEYWRHDYDWRRCEAMLNRFGQYYRSSLNVDRIFTNRSLWESL